MTKPSPAPTGDPSLSALGLRGGRCGLEATGRDASNDWTQRAGGASAFPHSRRPRTMDVGLFGGSFNPPHIAHLIVAETVREQFDLDEVWWMPAHTPPHKTGEAVASAVHRLAMVRRATASNPAFQVSSEEVERGGSSYTVETLRVLQERHPNNTHFALILGGDSLAGFLSWRRPAEIARRAELLVYRRPGAHTDPRDDGLDDMPDELAGRVRFAEAPLLGISGTTLRERRWRGQSLRYLVPEPVRAYIQEHDLYTIPHPAATD